MLDLTFDSRIDQSWIPSSTWRDFHFEKQERFAHEKADFLDDVPVMLATVLGLEMLLQEPFIDLRKASELVLSDVGATIQILRLIRRENTFATERPSRMDDCIAGLDASDWFSAMSARTFACDSEHAAVTAVWRHCRLVAQYAQLVAESIEGISPEHAYLVGLLHEIGAVPTVLGWPNGGSVASFRDPMFAMEGLLPLFVLAAMRSVNDSCPSSTWKLILTASHELAGACPDRDPSTLLNIDSIGIHSRWERFLPVIGN